MKRDDLLIWLLVAVFLAAVAATLIFAPVKSRHGYGEVFPEGSGVRTARSSGTQPCGT